MQPSYSLKQTEFCTSPVWELLYQTKKFIIKEDEAGNTEKTRDLIEYLQQKRPEKRLAIFGDGATYDNSQELKKYLTEINQNLSDNAPEQNPVEDI